MLSIGSFITSPFASRAQEVLYKWSVGGAVGIAGYFGEYGSKGIFSHPGYALSVLGRYIYDARWEFGADVSLNSVRGSLSDVYALPSDMPQKFNANVYALDFGAEFNFFPYGIGETFKNLRSWTPYVGAGIGLAGAKASGVSFKVTPELPLIAGVKIKINDRVNAKVGLRFAKTFTHGIDGISGVYGVSRDWFKGTDWVMSLQAGISYEFGERCPTCHYRD